MHNRGMSPGSIVSFLATSSAHTLIFQRVGATPETVVMASLGAGAAFLFAPQAGGRFRSSLREYMRRAKDPMDQATEQSKQPTARQGQADAGGIRIPGAECSVRSVQPGHTDGDTGHDNYKVLNGQLLESRDTTKTLPLMHGGTLRNGDLGFSFLSQWLRPLILVHRDALRWGNVRFT